MYFFIFLFYCISAQGRSQYLIDRKPRAWRNKNYRAALMRIDPSVFERVLKRCSRPSPHQIAWWRRFGHYILYIERGRIKRAPSFPTGLWIQASGSISPRFRQNTSHPLRGRHTVGRMSDRQRFKYKKWARKTPNGHFSGKQKNVRARGEPGTKVEWFVGKDGVGLAFSWSRLCNYAFDLTPLFSCLSFLPSAIITASLWTLHLFSFSF